jgi:hypothetical protein
LSARTNLNLLPGKLKIVALGGDLIVSGGQKMALIPSPNGDLQLASNSSVYLSSPINVSDNDINLLGSQLNPVSADAFRFALPRFMTTNRGSPELYHTKIPVHQSNSQPILVYAGKDIVGYGSFSLLLPKKSEIYAANDIKNFALLAQNLNYNDVTNISAGRDITNSLYGGSGIFLGGPGYLNVAAGRNINLNLSFGIITRGNLDNPYLPEAGANISILVGSQGYSDAIFSARYLSPSLTNPYNDSLVNFVKNARSLKPNDFLSVEDAWTAFKSMKPQLQNNFLQTVFFSELKLAGINHNDKESDGFGNYKSGFEAIQTYFPSSSLNGDLDISFSQLKTERGGGINILAPGGRVQVGLPKTPDSVILLKGGGTDFLKAQAASARVLGVFTIKGGDINIFAKDDIDVAQSRVFTVAGGDILNWSSIGDIDAGKGSKTAVSAPPPIVRTDTQGLTTVDLSGVVSGSGIGTLQTLKDAPLGNVYLIAPSGTVDAGDAGVRSSGNLLVAAQAVANGANMQAGGTSSGVPAPSTANVSFSAPVSADSSNSAKQADKATEAASKSASKTASALPSLITVEVLSLGDEASTTSDPEKDEKKKAKKQQN